MDIDATSEAMQEVNALSVVSGDGGALLPETSGTSATCWPVYDWANEYFMTDHLGTVRGVYEITQNYGEPITGPNVKAWKDYEPFGFELYAQVPQQTSGTRFEFTGHERDEREGGYDTDYMRFRFYGDSIGRFLRPDNISGTPYNPQSWNLYAYVRGNPVNFNDPTGHMGSPTGLQETKKKPTWDDKDALEKFNRLKDIPGAPYADAEYGGGGGGAGELPPINLKVPLYFDEAMNLTPGQRSKELSRLQTEVLAGAVDAYGAMGIMIDVYYAGVVKLALMPNAAGQELVITPVIGDPLPAKGLAIIRTNNRTFAGPLGRFALDPAIKGRGFIFLNARASSWTAIEEFAHAFGLGRHWLVDSPSPVIDAEVRLIKWSQWGKAKARRYARQYAVP